ncbi:hypothetical protein NMG60_11016488 [Bertholletia excelsa]
MAETEEKPQPQRLEKLSNMSFSIWPPTQRTRDAVIARLVENLSSPSHLSKRYGFVPLDEASEVARRIEDEAFAATGASGGAEDDGIEFLQFYAKEISQRMLSTIKSRSASASATNGDIASPAPAAVHSSTDNEASTVETEH